MPKSSGITSSFIKGGEPSLFLFTHPLRNVIAPSRKSDLSGSTIEPIQRERRLQGS